jgi:hypothetical protein
LHKSADFCRFFPRRGAFATGETDHHIVDPPSLARLDFDIAADVVALVDQAKRGHTFGQRGRLDIAGLHFGGGFGLQFSGNFGFFGYRRILGRLAAARSQCSQRGSGEQASHASGVHAW